LERTLRSLLDGPLRVTLTDNRRTMISLRRSPKLTELRLHRMFLQADTATARAIASYVSLGADAESSRTLGQYIEAHRGQIRTVSARVSRLSTMGAQHDLLAIYQDVCAQHFAAQAVDVRITWGRDATRSRKRARRAMKLGSYCARERLIRVHPALDVPSVPRFFLEYIVYHELLHHVLPVTMHGGRRQLHDARFKRMERAFPRYDEAIAWERANVGRLLRS
jgi:predicted metal-dependent hydrolase